MRLPIPPSDLLFYYHGSIREAVFNSRRFEALDSEIVRNIMHGSFGLLMLEKQIESFNEKSTSLLLVPELEEIIKQMQGLPQSDSDETRSSSSVGS